MFGTSPRQRGPLGTDRDRDRDRPTLDANMGRCTALSRLDDVPACQALLRRADGITLRCIELARCAIRRQDAKIQGTDTDVESKYKCESADASSLYVRTTYDVRTT